jgi:hypothetical protein
MPVGARLAIITIIALICAGAVWLMLVRGPALLLDLSGAAGRLICF